MKNKYDYIVLILFIIKIIVEFSQYMDKTSWWNVINLICGIIIVIGFLKNNKTIIVVLLVPSIVSKMIILGLLVITEVQSLLLSIPWEIFPIILIMNLCDFVQVVLYLIAILTKKELFLYISSVLLIISILIRFNGIGHGSNILIILFISLFTITLTKETSIFAKYGNNIKIKNRLKPLICFILTVFLLYQNLCCSEQSNGLLDTVSKNSLVYWGFHFCYVSIFFNFYYFKCS